MMIKHRWSRALPSTPLTLNSPKPLSGSTFIWKLFDLHACLMLDNCVILHMHLLTYAVACFFFFAMSWPRDSIVFQKMFNSGYKQNEYHKIPSMTGKRCLINERKFCHSGEALSHKLQKNSSVAGKSCLIDDGKLHHWWGSIS